MIVYLARDITPFVMYCVNGKPRSSLLIESTDYMITMLCGRDQCGLNAHSVDPDSMRIECWSCVDRP